jgi:hypothetical protein
MNTPADIQHLSVKLQDVEDAILVLEQHQPLTQWGTLDNALCCAASIVLRKERARLEKAIQGGVTVIKRRAT